MQIIIEIPDDEYEIIKTCTAPMTWVEYLIKNGIPLPKGHGRLIDADDAKREWSNVIDCEIEHPKYQCTIRDVLEDAPTIIPADKEDK